jgi:3-oxoacyl-[acyl-carrier-protein] synthase-3
MADNFYTFIKNCGNTVLSTIPIALYIASKENIFKKGQSILFARFDVGYSFARTILKCMK